MYHERLPTNCYALGLPLAPISKKAQAGQSKADFTAKMAIARKEARETLYWLRLLKAAEIVEAEKLSSITKQADELDRILTSIVKTSQLGKNS